MRLTVFSTSEGRLECMQRQSTRPAAGAPPLDLFDLVRAVLETRNQGRTWFIREAMLLRRRAGLGTSYEALTFACRFARLLARTPIHDDSRAAVGALLERALDAWETGTRPDAVYFKSLFLLARDEGYPVREAWLRTLRATDQATAESALRQPASAQTASEPDLRHITRLLEDYLDQEHDFIFQNRT